ncbi:MAG: hypothetical protein ACYC2G_08555 [Gemmatimonadaceae bacterium]
MQPTTLSGSLFVERLRSPDVLREAMRALPGHETRPGGDPAPEGLAVSCGEVPVLVLGLRRESVPAGFGLGRLRAIRVSPVLIASPTDGTPPGWPETVSHALRAALRELFVGEADWHVLRMYGLPEVVIDAAWRFGTRLGHACTLTREPPLTRAPDGVVAESSPVLAFYSGRLKGRWARAADSGFAGLVRSAAGERASVLARRLRGRRDGAEHESGSRFFVLELGSVPSAPSWGSNVTFREVPEVEAAADPLRFSTSVGRMEEALRRGDRCFATCVDGELAHHHWVSRDPEFLGRMLPERLLGRPTAHPLDSYTWPAFRGRGLQGATHHWLALQYRVDGVEQFAVRVSSFNSASIRGILKAGYVEL